MIAVTRAVVDTLAAETARAAPAECCGLLLGAAGRIDTVRPARNVAADPLRFFEIDPAVLIAAHREARAEGRAVLGYYHSHPTGVAEPSATDRAHAAGDGRVWAIVGFPTIGFHTIGFHTIGPHTIGPHTIGWWRDGPDGFERLPSPRIDG